MNSILRARSCRCSRAWNRSTTWVASGDFAVAMFQGGAVTEDGELADVVRAEAENTD
jgi:hypothetical protein